MRASGPLLVVSVLACVVPRLAAARPIEVPAFAIDASAEVLAPRVAVGTDGTMVLAWQSGSTVRAQLFSQAGTALAPPVTVATGEQPYLAADTRGGYVVAYLRTAGSGEHLFGRRLDGTGQPVGTELAVDQLPDDGVRVPIVVGLPSGFTFVWQQDIHCRLRRYDPGGVPLADALIVGENGFGLPLVATALDDGGMTVVWHDPSVHTLLGRSFNADGSFRAGPHFLSSVSFDAQSIGPTATGGIVVAGVHLVSTVRLVEYDASFDVVVQRDVETLPVDDTPITAIARDAVGRWLLVFATARYDTDLTHLQGYLAPRAVPLGADLLPLEPSFALADPEVSRITTALLPSGSFVNAWATAGAPGDARGWADVVSLCTADVHVCGDGILDPRCEECDAGAANDDATPDACRTSCLLPRCGDGVADAGEACDDGTASPCDGCDAACQPVAGLACGDGILVAGCSDQCDDGNAVAGDGCAPTCTLERVPGGGAPTTDCLAEWIVANPSNVPLVDGRGRMRRTQRCVDDDPACDFDAGTSGACTFHVEVCAQNGDVAGCAPAALTSWQLAKPSPQQAAHHPELATVRAAFASVPAAVVGVTGADSCSAPVDVVVPLRGTAGAYRTGRVALVATATAAGGRRDRDGLTLVCVPH